MARKIKDCNVAMLGFGLLGTSLGLALNGRCHRIAWARRRHSLDYGLKIGACDQIYARPEDAIAAADIVVLCLPVKTIISLAENLKDFFRRGTVVTDIGSVKRRIVEELEPLLAGRGVHFVGSHPMAGLEKSGAEAASADIYKNAVVFVTETEDTNPEAEELVSDLWKEAGARVINISAHLHDSAVAASSHLVHLSAAALARTVLNCPDDIKELLWTSCAGGFRDSTRVAMADPSMWAEIIEFNADNLIPQLEKLEKEIREIRSSLEKGDIESILYFLRQAADLRRSWNESKQPKPHPA